MKKQRLLVKKYYRLVDALIFLMIQYENIPVEYS